MDVVENDQQVLVLPWYFTVPAAIFLMVTGAFGWANAMVAAKSAHVAVMILLIIGKIWFEMLKIDKKREIV
jgi:hypothetical protein